MQFETTVDVNNVAGALVYVEIGTLIPLSGSSYYFLREVYGDLVGFLYMFTWVVFLLPGGNPPHLELRHRVSDVACFAQESPLLV